MIQLNLNLVRCRLAITAMGVMEVVRDKPFYVLISKISSGAIHFAKNMNIFLGGEVPETTDNIDENSSTGTGRPELKKEGHGSNNQDPTVAVHYKPNESKEDQMDTHETVQTTDAEKFSKNCRNEVNMPSTYDAYKPKFPEVISVLKAMWDGNPGRIKAAVHRIDRTPREARQIHSITYRARPKAGQFEKTEIDNMSRMGVIGPAQTEWASTIVFVRKKDG